MPDDTLTPSAGTGSAELVDALAQSAFTITAVLTRVGTENDLSLTQLRVLAILRDRRLRMSELAEYLGLEKSTMSGLVARAEARGLLGRAPSVTDGRAIDVFLTDTGTDLTQRLFAHITQSLLPMISVLGSADRQRLRSLLVSMLDGSTARG